MFSAAMSVRSTMAAALTPMVMAIASEISSRVAPNLSAFLMCPRGSPGTWRRGWRRWRRAPWSCGRGPRACRSPCRTGSRSPGSGGRPSCRTRAGAGPPRSRPRGMAGGAASLRSLSAPHLDPASSLAATARAAPASSPAPPRGARRRLPRTRRSRCARRRRGSRPARSGPRRSGPTASAQLEGDLLRHPTVVGVGHEQGRPTAAAVRRRPARRRPRCRSRPCGPSRTAPRRSPARRGPPAATSGSPGRAGCGGRRCPAGCGSCCRR